MVPGGTASNCARDFVQKKSAFRAFQPSIFGRHWKALGRHLEGTLHDVNLKWLASFSQFLI
jgi:hypothetical protein